MLLTYLPGSIQQKIIQFFLHFTAHLFFALNEALVFVLWNLCPLWRCFQTLIKLKHLFLRPVVCHHKEPNTQILSLGGDNTCFTAGYSQPLLPHPHNRIHICLIQSQGDLYSVTVISFLPPRWQIWKSQFPSWECYCMYGFWLIKQVIKWLQHVTF